MGHRSKYLQTLDDKFKLKTDEEYLIQTVYELQNSLSEIFRDLDGNIKSSFLQQRELWTPVLKGTAVSGTFTYGNQIGWVYRQGLMVDVWCDITWTAAGTAAGNLYLELPYLVANTTGYPFIGAVQYSGITLGAGNTNLFIDAVSDTYRGEFWQTGTGLANTNLGVLASGSLRLHLRYIGVRDE